MFNEEGESVGKDQLIQDVVDKKRATIIIRMEPARPGDRVFGMLLKCLRYCPGTADENKFQLYVIEWPVKKDVEQAEDFPSFKWGLITIPLDGVAQAKLIANAVRLDVCKGSPDLGVEGSLNKTPFPIVPANPFVLDELPAYPDLVREADYTLLLDAEKQTLNAMKNAFEEFGPSKGS